MIPWPDLWRVFGRIGWLSFGGPAAQIALMHRELVDGRRWLSEQDFLRALSFCMLLPGPEAMQLATYAGWKLRGIRGGLLAGLLFVGPGVLVIFALAAAYLAWGGLPLVGAAFLGIKACVVALVVEALVRVAKRALATPAERAVAAGAFVALVVLALPFPLIILAAAGLGAALFARPAAGAPPAPAPAAGNPALPRVLAAGGAAWAAPLLLAWGAGWDFLLSLGLFFSKLAVVTFGGAYAVLAYMTQEIVQDHGWVTAGQMMDALGLAETTPGPLILVTQFVAILAGHAQGGAGLALAAAAMVLWVTFVPCFIWIFAFAPYVERITGRPRLAAALRGVTAAVVGVIASLALWFALHLFFGGYRTVAAGPFLLPVPDPSALDWRALAIALAAGWALMVRHWNVLAVLAASALVGLAASLL